MNNLIFCPICEKKLKSLMSHIRIIHNLTPTQILEKYPNTKFVSDDVKNKASKSCIKSKCGRPPGCLLSDDHKQKISIAVSNEKNPFYGKKHSDITKEKMSQNHADFNGNKNPLVKWLDRDPKNKEKYSSILKESRAKKWSNEEYRKIHSERLSKQVSKLYLNGFNPYTNCKHGWFESKKFSTKFYFQSSYEQKFLEFCETSPKISSLQRVPFVIPYKDNGGIERNYCADFFVNRNVVIEIKPKTMLGYNNNVLKIEFGKKYCKENGYEYKLLMESELDDLENFL